MAGLASHNVLLLFLSVLSFVDNFFPFHRAKFGDITRQPTAAPASPTGYVRETGRNPMQNTGASCRDYRRLILISLGTTAGCEEC